MAAKKLNPSAQTQLTLFFASSCESASSFQLTHGNDDEASQTESSHHQKFLTMWKMIYLWADTESENDDEKAFCQECRRAKLSNVFALSKTFPTGGWKKEYLQRHASSLDHVRASSLDHVRSC